MYRLFIIFIFITSCGNSELPDEIICDCKELQHQPDYNVFHLGDPLNPFTGTCYDYYQGGVLKKDCQLIEGKYDGVLKFYHKNGQLLSESDYKEGLLFGDKKNYDENGKLLFHGVYKRSHLIETKFHHLK